ncbi:MAG TPA: DNA gyrase subunit A [Jatrophihabitantaceae bacterium]|jgi:DNA gyrase subunit A|nr:DNA gyrase subunit A [Jatrophihabitantaceae bacterium]
MPLNDSTALRLEILDALILAVENRRRLFDVIAAAPSADQARQDLMAEFDLNEIQATAVLDLQARRFAELERTRLVQERQAFLNR